MNAETASVAASAEARTMRSFVTDRPVAVLMVFAAALVFGYFSLNLLPVTLMPELTYPTITVRTEYAGAAPEEVENDISRPIEEKLGVISGLKEISSISRSGISDVVLKFNWGTDIAVATQDVLEKLDRVRLNKQAERPLLLHFDPALDPVMELSLSGTGPRFSGVEGLRRLRRIAELQVKRALEPIKGVAAVQVRGGLEEEIHVIVNKTLLKRSGLNIDSLSDRLQQENINVPGGTIKEGATEYTVRTLNEFESLEQIRETIVTYIDDKPLRVKDIATVVNHHKEREIITSADGQVSVQIDIYKEADVNIVALAGTIASALGPAPDFKQRKQRVKGKGKISKPRGKAEKSTGKKVKQRVDKSGGQLNRQRPVLGKGKPRGLSAQLFQNEGARLVMVADRSTFIKSSINEVKKTAILGGLLAILVLYLFLRNVKTTVIIALSIPMSLLITFAPMHIAGVSLNIMSLGGLALGIGMLVDSSIVVLESIFRCREEGDNLQQAAVRGTREVRSAVFASTLTSVAVFLPMVFVEGLAGEAFSDLGITVVISLFAAFIVAMVFIPMLASRRGIEPVVIDQLDSGPKTLSLIALHWRSLLQQPRWVTLSVLPLLYLLLRSVVLVSLHIIRMITVNPILFCGTIFIKYVLPKVKILLRGLVYFPLKVSNVCIAGLNKTYMPVLRWVTNHSNAMILVVVCCFLAIYVIGSRLNTELLPEIHQGEFTLEVQMPIGTPIEDTYAVLEKVEKKILQNKNQIKNLLVTYGYDVASSQNSEEGEHTAKFKVILAPNINQKETEQMVIKRLRQYFDSVPDAEISIVRPVLFSETALIEVEIQADDLYQLKSKSVAAKALMNDIEALSDVETSLRRGAPEIQVEYDRNKLIRYGLNVRDVAEAVRDMVKGFEATRFNMVDRRIPIVVQLDEKDRATLEDIAGLPVYPRGGSPIPLYSIAKLSIGEGPSEVRRIDGQRVAVLSANINSGSLSAAVAEINKTLNENIDWPEGMAFAITGQSQEWENSKGSLYLALALSIFLVYVIMAAQFESLLHPFIIMFSIPLAFIGTMLALYMLNLNISIVVLLGMIMLAGIVVNNAIVLVDYINTLRQRGMQLADAVFQAAQVRLRPILMTTMTTILGLLPMALGLGDGAEIRTPMAIAVIAGLFSSTLLTLIVIPVLYCRLEEIKARLLSRKIGGQRNSELTPTETEF